MKKLPLVFCITLLTGCAIQQRVTPVAGLASPEVCIIENGTVRAGFSDELRTGGGANPGKFIDAGVKIRELVDKLFPAKAGA